MLKNVKKTYYQMGAAFTVGMLSSTDAFAQNTFSDIARNITDSVSDIPGLISALSYLFGILLGVLGILKIKDHVENPTQTPLKDGAIRLAAGGALFALPIILESMFETVGSEGTATSSAVLNAVDFTVGGGG